MSDRLPPHQFALLRVLGEEEVEPGIDSISAASGIDQALLSAAAIELQERGLLLIEEHPYTELKLGEGGQQIAQGLAELPERTIARALRARGGSAAIKDLGEDAELQAAGVAAGRYIRNMSEIGWASFGGGTMTLTEIAASGEPQPSAEELLLLFAHENGGTLVLNDATEPHLAAAAERMKQRRELISLRERSRRRLVLTTDGEELAAALIRGEVSELRQANELTAEMLADGSWRDVEFRAYNVTLAAETLHPGKPHPLVRIIEEVRLAFLELGFSEASCPMAETAFWDFDSLFQPQDHPAREMQDTFYCKTPSKYKLPDEALVERVRAVHENGGDTGSLGWRYKWSPERAAQVVLRTHMTASSIEAIARNPNPPQKVFSIGRVFRRETVDYKHLPEFYQVDGIIIDESASLVTLMGTLTKFYERLGIPQVMLKPDFFPYTEPSVGVLIRYGGKWMEMGGAGIFRPEVTRPVGCTAPVIAWGLGLERLAMARFGISSIKELYQSDLDWLKAVPLEA